MVRVCPTSAISPGATALIIEAFLEWDVDVLEEAVAMHIRGGASRVLAARVVAVSELSLKSCLTRDREALGSVPPRDRSEQ